MPNFPEISGAMQESAGVSNKAQLDSMMSEIKNKKANLDSIRSEGAINDQELRQKLLGSLFEVLQASGVDPNDLGSISQFLQELEAQSPDLFRLFQEAFDVLAGNAPQEQGGQGLMQRFGNLAQGAMMPPEGAGPMSGGPPIEEPVAGGPPMMPMQ